MTVTFVLGGARSGKSAIAERLVAAAGKPVTYVATMVLGTDPSLGARVAAHRARRPADWPTVDAGDDLAGTLRTICGPVLLDSLGPWVAGRPDFAVDAISLCAALRNRSGDTVVVSDEVGLGVHPSTEAGGAFRDSLGAVNRAVAGVADRVLFVVAGMVLPLRPAPES